MSMFKNNALFYDCCWNFYDWAVNMQIMNNNTMNKKALMNI